MARSLSHQAWEAARTRLADLHPTEFRTLYDEERVARGLKPTATRLFERLAEAESEVERLRAQLGIEEPAT